MDAKTYFTPASAYVRDDAPTTSVDDGSPCDAVVPGYECPMSGYILTAEAIAKGYCERQSCVRFCRRDMVNGCRGAA